jgi:hypothetical protein
LNDKDRFRNQKIFIYNQNYLYIYFKNIFFTYKDIHKISLIIVNNEDQFCLQRIHYDIVNKEILYKLLDNYIHMIQIYSLFYHLIFLFIDINILLKFILVLIHYLYIFIIYSLIILLENHI